MNNFIFRILCLVTVAALLVSCTPTEQAVVNHFDADGNFIPGRQMEITVWETQGTDYVMPRMIENNIVEEWLAERTGVRINNAFGNGGGSWESRFNMLLAGDNLPELLHIGGGQGPVHLARLNRAGRVHELTPELLQRYAPTIWQTIPESVWDMLRVDGKILGIPYSFNILAFNEHPQLRLAANLTDEELEIMLGNVVPNNAVTSFAAQPLGIRDDVLTQLFPDAKTYAEIEALVLEHGAPVGDMIVDAQINTTEEFVQFLRDIKNLGIEVHGRPMFALGYDGGDLWFPLTYLGAEMMGFVTRNYITTWDFDNNRVIMPLLEDITKEALRIQSMLVRENVIDPESLMHNAAQYREMVLNGQYAIVNLSTIGGLAAINEQLAARGATFRYRPFFNTMPNDPRFPAGEIAVGGGWQMVMAILDTVNERDIPQILNWMDVMFSDEFDEIRFWGTPEAGLFTEQPDGTRVFNDPMLQTYVVEGDRSALELVDSMGLSTVNFRAPIGAFTPMTTGVLTRWNPLIRNNIRTYSVATLGSRFPLDSPHVTSLVTMPDVNSWSPRFAGISLVEQLMTTRNQWEDPFKLTLTAGSDEEFEVLWRTAYETIHDILDVQTMLDQMTEIVLEEW